MSSLPRWWQTDGTLQHFFCWDSEQGDIFNTLHKSNQRVPVLLAIQVKLRKAPAWGSTLKINIPLATVTKQLDELSCVQHWCKEWQLLFLTDQRKPTRTAEHFSLYPPPQTLTLSNHSWIHCHLIIFEEGKDPSRMSGHCVSCPQWGPKIGEAHSRLIMLSEKYLTHPICPTPSTHMLPCFSHTSWNCSAVALYLSNEADSLSRFRH